MPIYNWILHFQHELLQSYSFWASFILVDSYNVDQFYHPSCIMLLLFVPIGWLYVPSRHLDHQKYLHSQDLVHLHHYHHYYYRLRHHHHLSIPTSLSSQFLSNIIRWIFNTYTWCTATSKLFLALVMFNIHDFRLSLAFVWRDSYWCSRVIHSSSIVGVLVGDRVFE